MTRLLLMSSGRLRLAVWLVLVGHVLLAEDPAPAAAPAPDAPAAGARLEPGVPPAAGARLEPGVPPAAGARLEPGVPGPAAGLQLNFRGAPIDTVLDYLSQAGGFVIVRDAAIPGNIDLVSHQPLSADEAVNLLHTVLNDRGYAIVRNERVLRIVKSADARGHNVPVCTGSDPATVPPTDEVVTQIIPIRHTKASKLIDTLKPLLPAQAVVTSNDDSNALVLTDTRLNIRRIMEIIRGLDTAVASILDIRVMPLRYADAADTAAAINKVFESPTAATSSAQNPFNQRNQFFARMRGGPGGDLGETDTNEAKQTAAHVAAVADQRANAVIVTAPTELLPQVQELVTQLDVPTEATSTLKVFPLRFADATEMANLLASLYPNTNTTTQQGGRNQQFGRGFFPMPPGMQATTSTTTKSERKLAEATVVAVADTRTNSVIVSASPTTMTGIQTVVEQLDATAANVPTVYVYHLENADVTNAKAIIEGLYDKLNTGSTQSTSTSNAARTTQRATTGTNATRPTNSDGTGSSSGTNR